MKINKMIKTLLVGCLVVLTVGCQEAEQIENIDVQDTNPIEAQEDVCCEYCNDIIWDASRKELVKSKYESFDDEYKEHVEIAKHAIEDYKKNGMSDAVEFCELDLENYIKFKGCSECANYECAFSTNKQALANGEISQDEYDELINRAKEHLDKCNYPHSK